MGEDDGAPMLDVRGLSHRYPGAEVDSVADVSLTAGRGEVLGLVGESGSGKSTLLRAIAGLEPPDAGSIRLAGRTVSGSEAWTPPEERPVGMLFQEGALFPHLDVAENVEFGLRGRDREERRSRRSRVLRLVGLSEYGDRYPHQLSGGQRRRVALARALAPEPELLLLDEPFTGLDANLTTRLRSEVGRILRETGTTALLVLHDTDEVLPLADRIGVLDAGRLVQSGPPEEVYARPRTEYVARLFGPVNLLPTRRRGDEVRSPLGPHGAGPSPVEEAELKLCYRPEDLELGRSGEFAAEGRVVEVGYRGDRLELLLRVPADGEPTAEVRVHSDGAGERAADLAPGSTVSLRPKPGRGHLIRERDRRTRGTPPPGGKERPRRERS